ncbi:MAG: DUF695 domain-containing protein [Sphingopyxis sp.]|uniref:DUF695 domain-containing protein n=1 Tax=Sphingopyxis sp. TaxID=1908224 RepID=UPI002ABAAE99|nr:DUF695 domain-containing protein [Sphingopyxis sp.]MDZ3831166.1 DUF695 domain-containing protein [Sphingopyxis sp.]
MAKGMGPNGPILARYRSGMPSNADKALFSNLVIVRWQYADASAGTFPDDETLDRMVEFEDAILDASDHERYWGSGVAVVTENGAREWRFYTPDASEFMENLNRVLAGKQAFPLDFQLFDDPEWLALAELQQRTASDKHDEL